MSAYDRTPTVLSTERLQSFRPNAYSPFDRTHTVHTTLRLQFLQPDAYSPKNRASSVIRTGRLHSQELYVSLFTSLFIPPVPPGPVQHAPGRHRRSRAHPLHSGQHEHGERPQHAPRLHVQLGERRPLRRAERRHRHHGRRLEQPRDDGGGGSTREAGGHRHHVDRHRRVGERRRTRRHRRLPDVNAQDPRRRLR